MIKKLFIETLGTLYTQQLNFGDFGELHWNNIKFSFNRGIAVPGLCDKRKKFQKWQRFHDEVPSPRDNASHMSANVCNHNKVTFNNIF